MEINEHTLLTDPEQQKRLRSRSRKHWLARLNSGLAIVFMLALVVMINYLSGRHYARYDWSRAQFYQLSGKTHSLLASLAEPVKVTVFIQPEHEVHQLIYDDVVYLLREYENMSQGRLAMERVDPGRHLGRSEAMMTRFGLDRSNVIILEMGDRFRVVKAEEMADLDFQPLVKGGLPKMTAFRGEQAISSALLSLSESVAPKVYFLQGHGERDFDERDEYVGLSRMGQMIRRDHMELLPFNFLDRSTLPEDANVLVIAGPPRPYSAQEIERITAYVNRGGRLLMMLGSDTDAGFGPLLSRWGIRSVNNMVIDPDRTLSGFDVLTSTYADHPITEQLRQITTVFYWPRALPLIEENRDDSADKPKATPLAFSSGKSWAETDLEQRPQKFNPGKDLPGPLPLAVAVERGSRSSSPLTIAPNRHVVFGDVDFISNSGISGGNGDLFLNALNWILERNYLMDIAPRPVDEVKILINRKQLARLFRLVVVIVPVAAALLGFLVWFRRRS